MIWKTTPRPRPFAREFLDWQVALRRYTMEESFGAPHAGVAPLLTVKRPGGSLGVTTHSIICGVLPAPDRLEAKTAEFRALYEAQVSEGSRAVYDAGIEYLKGYYGSAEGFDPDSITTLLGEDGPVVRALRAEPRCALVFYVFDLEDQSEVGKLRCLQLDALAELHGDGPVYENVWWHNALFHGKVEGSVAVRFRHLKTLDTRFGRLEEVS